VTELARVDRGDDRLRLAVHYPGFAPGC
jgi:hypothetical protein